MTKGSEPMTMTHDPVPQGPWFWTLVQKAPKPRRLWLTQDGDWVGWRDYNPLPPPQTHFHHIRDAQKQRKKAIEDCTAPRLIHHKDIDFIQTAVEEALYTGPSSAFIDRREMDYYHRH